MNYGLDMDTDITAECGCIKAAGITFVGRYINRMGLPEANHIRSQGLYIFSIFETNPTSYEYFSDAQGSFDAATARACALRLTQPAHTPIYFAVDFDATEEQVQGNISDYFAAICRVFSNGIMNDYQQYIPGGYGSGLVLSTLQRQEQIQYAYLAAATDWRGSANFTAWNLKQSLGPAVCGINCDHVVSDGDGGGWSDT